ncbi:MAG: hypothetical protein WBJ13_01365 [Sedimentibacter sp.]
MLFEKDKYDADWFPYYNLLPKVYESEIFHLEPGESKEFKSETTIQSEDERLINTYFNEIRVKSDVVKEIRNID